MIALALVSCASCRREVSKVNLPLLEQLASFRFIFRIWTSLASPPSAHFPLASYCPLAEMSPQRGYRNTTGMTK